MARVTRLCSFLLSGFAAKYVASGVISMEEGCKVVESLNALSHPLNQACGEIVTRRSGAEHSNAVVLCGGMNVRPVTLGLGRE